MTKMARAQGKMRQKSAVVAKQRKAHTGRQAYVGPRQIIVR